MGTGRISAVFLGIGAAALAACGSTSTQPEVASASPLTASNVSASQSGNAAVQIDPTNVTYRRDDSGSLVVTVSATSTSSSSQTVTARVSLYDASGNVIGDAVGGSTSVDPGQTVALQLNGPAPNGTIASALFEVNEVASPTAISNTPFAIPSYTP